jgi:hypothetical protein
VQRGRRSYGRNAGTALQLRTTRDIGAEVRIGGAGKTQVRSGCAGIGLGSRAQTTCGMPPFECDAEAGTVVQSRRDSWRARQP